MITADDGSAHDSGLVMYPPGHARNTTADLAGLLSNKWTKLATPAVDEPQRVIDRFNNLPLLSVTQLAALYDFGINERGSFK